jgi:hypothetical protein
VLPIASAIDRGIGSFTGRPAGRPDPNERGLCAPPRLSVRSRRVTSKLRAYSGATLPRGRHTDAAESGAATVAFHGPFGCLPLGILGGAEPIHPAAVLASRARRSAAPRGCPPVARSARFGGTSVAAGVSSGRDGGVASGLRIGG